jgi:ribosomal protein L11 methyltransferase
MRWFRVATLVPAAAAEDAAASLAQLGASGVRIHEGDPSRLESHYERDIAREAAEVAARFGGRVESAEWAEEEDWTEAWKKRARPLIVGRFCVHPSHEPPRAGLLNLRIDPGMAFGTGDHPTTRLMLLELQALSEERPLGKVLDLGCGSGILAMAAVRLGAREVVAADTDARAVEIARENARENGMEGRIRFVEGSLEQCGCGFDEIVANLSTEAHLGQGDSYPAALAAGGRLRLGGVRGEETESVARVLRAGVARAGEGWSVLELEASP